MASRNDYSQNRKLYVGTAPEVTVADGNAIVTGKVGIGVTGPVAPLDVFGAALQNGSTPGIKLSSSNTQQTVFAIGNTGTRQYELAVGGTTSSVPGAFYIYDNNATDFRITIATSGNVGIGTTTPDSNLDVKGPSATPADGNQTLSITNSTGGTQLNLGTAENAYGWIEAREGATLRNLLLNPNGGNVGIGVTGPDNKLMVQGASTNGAASAGNVALFEGPSGTNGLKVFVDDTENAAGFQTISADDLLINPHSGNVGIGTAGPISKFTVTGTDNTNQANIGHSTQSVFIKVNGTNVDYNSSGNSGGSHTFSTGNIERMRITVGGNVGIGTTAINGAFGASNTILAVKGKTSGGEGIIQITGLGNNATDNVGVLAFHSYNEADAMCSIRSIRGSADDIGNMAFLTNNGGTESERMRITSGGDVGIGTADGPDDVNSKLHVYKNAGANTVVELLRLDCGENNHLVGKGGSIIWRDINVYTNTASITAQRTGNTGNSTLQFGLRGSEKMRIDSAGAIKFNAYDSTNNTGTPTYLLGTDASGNVVKTLSSSAPGSLWAASGNDIYNTNSANVGIGTTNPTQKLHLDGNNYNTATRTTFLIRDVGNNYNQGDNAIDIVMRSRYWSGDQNTSQNSKIRHLKDNSNGSTGTQLRFSTTTRGAGDSSDKMTILASGNVGIGETGPVNKLNVNGDIGYIGVIGQGNIYGNTGNSSYANMQLYDPATGYSTFNNQSYGYYLQTGGSTKLTILNNGNVGIGTTSPGSRRLSVVKDTGITAGFNDITEFLDTTLGGGGSVSLNIGKANSSKNLGKMAFKYVSSGSNSNALNFGFYDADNLMTLQAGGNVGIGTEDPDKLLHVGDGSATLSAPQGAEIEGYNNTLDVKTNEGNNISDFTPAINLFCDGVTGSSGTGTGIYFRAKTGGGGGGEYTKGRIQGAVYTSWTTNTDATRTSKLVIQTTNNGTHADRVTILGNGDFGINDTSPSNKLDVNGDIRGTQYKLRGNVSNPTSTAATIYDQSGVGLTLSAHNVELRNYNGSAMARSVFFTHNTATFTGTCTATNFILSSDKALKDNIREIDTKHVDVEWKNFELKSEPGVKRSGVIAQELEKKHPEFVRTNKDGLKSVAYIDLLIAKIAELEARLEKAGL